MAKALEVNKVLTSLDLSYNGLGSGGATAIAGALSSGMAVLTHLNLAENSIGPEGAAAICVRLLIAAGADATATHNGWTPLHAVAWSGDHDDPYAARTPTACALCSVAPVGSLRRMFASCQESGQDS